MPYKRKYSEPSGPMKEYKRRRKTGTYSRTVRGRFSGSQGELKFFDTAINFQLDATAEVPATGQLVLIPQGVTEATRVGRKCTIKSIQLRGQFTFAPGGSSLGAHIGYIYLVQDTQTNGAAAGITDVLTSNAMRDAMINMNNSSRFRIIKRFVYEFNSGAGVGGALNNIVRALDWYKKCNIPLEFSDTSGAITTIRSNNLFLVAGGAGGDDLIQFAGTCRVRFSDN